MPYGYTLFGSIRANQLAFFKYPQFDPVLLRYAESRKQPVTVGELITLGAGTVKTQFTGPVHVVTGANDFIFCGGMCNQTYMGYSTIPGEVQALFPNSTSFSTYLPPGTGHGSTSLPALVPFFWRTSLILHSQWSPDSTKHLCRDCFVDESVL